MAPWQKENNAGIYVTLFGVLLLFLKLIGVPVGIGYFLIFCIILWPVTLIFCIICFMLFALLSMTISERIGERK